MDARGRSGTQADLPGPGVQPQCALCDGYEGITCGTAVLRKARQARDENNGQQCEFQHDRAAGFAGELRPITQVGACREIAAG
jgi:hypothetical protein